VRGQTGERGVDFALDPVGGRATASCRRLLGPLGRLVFYGMSDAMPGKRRNWPRALLAFLRTPRIHPLSLVQANLGIIGVHLLHLGRNESVLRNAFGSIVDGIGEGRYSPVVDRTFPLGREGAVEAHTYVHERKSMGKVVLTNPD
jgi:NADPH:quinone reductase-like Zn-dependent oxidoreductase